MPETTPSNFAVIGSNRGSDADTGAVSVKLGKGDKVLFRTGSLVERQSVLVGSGDAFLRSLPVVPRWIVLDFSNDSLPDSFSATFVDEGASRGEWSAIALQFQSAPLEQLGEALGDIPVKVSGDWVKDGYYPGSGRPPVKTSIIGSWVRSDADTGTIRIGPFRTASLDAIALPILTGPVSKKLSVVVVDARSGATIAQLSPPPVFTKWRAWKIVLPRRAMRLEIIVKDEGAEWGEWLAVGMPHALK